MFVHKKRNVDILKHYRINFRIFYSLFFYCTLPTVDIITEKDENLHKMEKTKTKIVRLALAGRRTCHMA